MPIFLGTLHIVFLNRARTILNSDTVDPRFCDFQGPVFTMGLLFGFGFEDQGETSES